jgi:alginate O-acetyltransferase complex protein AlgI
MLFNSQVFLFVFLPLTLAVFFAVSRHGSAVAAQLWLTAASFIFYAWSGWQFLPILCLSILVNYAAGYLLVRGSLYDLSRKTLLVASVSFNLLLLAYFKYAAFLSANVMDFFGLNVALGNIALPIGISFFTFTQIAFLVDAARGEAKEYDLPRYALFVTFFPHLIAGPIIHHKEMMPQFANAGTYRYSPENLAVGLSYFAMGLFKKVVFADGIAPFATPVFAAADLGAAIPVADAWIAALAYALQIYFDFSAYSDMAIGLARMFNINLPINFNSPYKSLSIVEFWRRWHMTLSRFLRDYLYFPLGGNRKGPLRRYVNLMITMVLGGLWHGAGWTFVIWGGLHGAYLVINHLWRTFDRQLPRMLAWPVTFLAVLIAWVFFRAGTFQGALAMLLAMAGRGNGFTAQIVAPTACMYIAALLAIALFLPNTQQIMRAYLSRDFYDIEPVEGPAARLAWHPTRMNAYAMAAVLVSACLLIPKASTFLYFQF